MVDAIFKSDLKLVLASASPRRRELLAGTGLAFDVFAAEPCAEPSPFAGEPPEMFAERAALAKALNVAGMVSRSAALRAKEQAVLPGAIVIGADTVVSLDSVIYGKPENPDDAFFILRRLAGRTHLVSTGCALIGPFAPHQAAVSDKLPRAVFSVTTRVTMHNWPDNILRAYASDPEPSDKAGAYAIQGKGAFLIKSIEGSWSNVVGLPLTEILQALMPVF